jgi:hypothetical protein
MRVSAAMIHKSSRICRARYCAKEASDPVQSCTPHLSDGGHRTGDKPRTLFLPDAREDGRPAALDTLAALLEHR